MKEPTATETREVNCNTTYYCPDCNLPMIEMHKTGVLDCTGCGAEYERPKVELKILSRGEL